MHVVARRLLSLTRTEVVNSAGLLSVIRGSLPSVRQFKDDKRTHRQYPDGSRKKNKDTSWRFSEIRTGHVDENESTWFGSEHENEKEPLMQTDFTVFDELGNKFKVQQEFSVTEWEELRKSIMGLPFDSNKVVNKTCVDSVILRQVVEERRLDTGMSYRNYIAKVTRTGLNWSHYDYLLKLFLVAEDLGEHEQCAVDIASEVLDRGYDNLIPYFFWNSIEILARTYLWRDALAKALDVTKTCNNEAGSIQAFTGLAMRAFHEKELDLMWDLMDNRQFHQDNIALRQALHVFSEKCQNRMYVNWVNYCHSMRVEGKESEADLEIEKLYKYFARHGIFPSVDTQTAIIDYYRLSLRPSAAVYTRVEGESGTCHHCKSNLSPCTMEEEQFHTLQREMLSLMTRKGGDVYTTTDPDELDNFMKLINSKGPFDVVIDGLNVQLHQLPKSHHKIYQGSNTLRTTSSVPTRYQSLNLRDTVAHFKQQGLRVLVVHRKASFVNLPDSRQISNMATCVLLNRVTEDDPYMILAAIHSGLGCRIVTNDKLRQHSVILARCGSAMLAKIFTDWQVLHQVRISGFAGYSRGQARVNFSDPKFVMPPKHGLRAHFSPPFWHLPVRNRINPEVKISDGLAIPSSWLCVGPDLKEERELSDLGFMRDPPPNPKKKRFRNIRDLYD